MKRICFMLMGILFFCGMNLHAAKPEYHPIDKEKWEKAVDGKDYVEQKEEEEEAETSEFPEQKTPFSVSFDWLKIVIFVAIAALLIFILIRVFGKGLFRNQKLETKDVAINDLEDRPMESDLERFLREAVESKNYRLAVRIYYLMLLKSLQDKELITWKKNKTNFDYLSEVTEHPQFRQLNDSTLVYEFVWYGERNIAEPQFNSISVSFIDIIRKITSR